MKNLQIKVSSSQDKSEMSSSNNNVLSFSSCEIKASRAVFKKDGFTVDNNGIKMNGTNESVGVINPKELEIGEFLGCGASGSVRRARHIPSGKEFAIKSINLYEKNMRNQFKNDLRVLADNKCNNIIRFYGAFFTQGNVKIVLEYMNLGSLDRVLEGIKKKKIPQPCVPESILSKIVFQILKGIFYLHKNKHQIHRDIKPANILINIEGVVKLTDFGISRILENTNDFSHTFIGSKNFMSPERIIASDYSYPSDIWSLGLVVYELATGTYPYDSGTDLLLQIKQITEGPEPKLDNKVFSEEFCDFMGKALKKNPSERASINDLINHPWITKHANDKDDVSQWLANLFDYKLTDA